MVHNLGVFGIGARPAKADAELIVPWHNLMGRIKIPAPSIARAASHKYR